MDKNTLDSQYQKGFQEGMKNKSISIAIKMVNRGYNTEEIQELTELKSEEIAIISETLLLNQHNVDKIIENQQSSGNFYHS